MPTAPDERSALDSALEILANPHRRRLLVALLGRSPGTPVTPADASVEGEPQDGWSAYLVHTHLPKLDDAGFIEWDRGSEEVRAGPRFEEIRPLLELLDDHADELPYAWP